jgi:hypothetical protein
LAVPGEHHPLVITAGWTGCRWGELAGLQRDRADLARGVIRIDRVDGCLHESSHGQWLGPPKTFSSARTIQLPPFLVDLLRKHLACHPSQFVFTAPHGGWLRRSDFNRRFFRPAVEGDPRRGLVPVRPGLTFHGLRHSHKTWLANDLIMSIASAKRLGHHVPGKLEEAYTHVAPKMERQILKLLQQMWQHAQHAAARPVDNFDRDTIEALTGRWVALLRQVVADPAQAIGEIDLIDGAERELLASYNNTSRPPEPRTLAELFQEQVGRDPAAPALAHGDERLSYGELNARANRLAHWLIDRGVGPERRVVVMLPRSIDLVVAIMAVVKAGGTFVPIDPGQPARRREQMIEDSAPVLTLDADAMATDVADRPSTRWSTCCPRRTRCT